MIPLLRDLLPLIAVQGTMLAATLAFGPGNIADCRVQSVWCLYLVAGWWITPVWSCGRETLLSRYLKAMTSSTALFSLIIPPAAFLGWSPRTVGFDWVLVICLAAVFRYRSLAKANRPPTLHIAWRHVALIATVSLFAVSVYRTPRSNDIHQFLLQQQDMLLTESLAPSDVGMAAMEVDKVMPRWRANYWHALPVLLADASGIAVDQIVLRYATIPVAFSVLLCAIEMVRRLTGPFVGYGAIGLAVLGPIVLWYRNFNAFNYSFRITNNLLLDKDFALFFLIPATLWLVSRVMKGRRRGWIPLLALVPALLRFHPMTPIYLSLLFLPLAALSMPRSRDGLLRTGGLGCAAVLLFLAVVVIGDAQSYHDKIRQVIAMDYQQHLTGRPFHYWVGFYNAIEQMELPSDTAVWRDGRLKLKASLVVGCGLLAVTHLCWIALAVCLLVYRRSRSQVRLFVSGTCVLGTLWFIQVASGFVLTQSPHYAAGFERLHWFAYPIAWCVVSGTVASWIPKRLTHRFDVIVLILVTLSAIAYRAETATPLIHVRGLNSLLDAELPAKRERRQRWAEIDPRRTLRSLKPTYLRPNDRVLVLDARSTSYFWLTRQGLLWSDPYIEAFAWHHRGDEFLAEREMYYRLLDRLPVDGLKAWIERSGVSVIVDPRPNGDERLAQLARRYELPLRRIQRGVWRIDSP